MLTNPLHTITQTLAEHGDKDRGYLAELDGDKLTISYITAIKYDKEPDPQISREPEVSIDSVVEIVPIGVSEGMLQGFIRALIEEIETKSIRYE